MKLEDQRKETHFAAMDNMLNIWEHLTELCYRGFGIKNRKLPREPKNFSSWSEKSKTIWYERESKKVLQQEEYDKMFVQRETTVIDNMCRKIVFMIDQANELHPYYLFEADKMRGMQDDAILGCSNLKRELNHIMTVIPCNKNFIVKIQADIEEEIRILRGWKKSGNDIRKKTIENEINQRKTIAKKMGFILCNEELTE